MEPPVDPGQSGHLVLGLVPGLERDLDLDLALPRGGWREPRFEGRLARSGGAVVVQRAGVAGGPVEVDGRDGDECFVADVGDQVGAAILEAVEELGVVGLGVV